MASLSVKLGTTASKQIESMAVKWQVKFWIMMDTIVSKQNGRGKRLYNGKLKKKYNQGTKKQKSDAIYHEKFGFEQYTYVIIWKWYKKINKIEIVYAGTHGCDMDQHHMDINYLQFLFFYFLSLILILFVFLILFF